MAGTGRSATLSVCLVALLIPLGCNDSNPRGDGIENYEFGSPCAVPDKNVDIKTAQAVTAGQKVTGFICPTRDNDYYKVEHSGTLLKIELSGSLEDTGTPIQLTYLILDKDGKTVGNAPAWNGAGIRAFKDFHCLGSGTYYIQIRDEGDDGKDGNNAYNLTVTSSADKDTNEPGNNTQAGAKPPSQGYISCKGDQDWFSVNVGANQLMEVSLKSDKASSIDLKYTIIRIEKDAAGKDVQKKYGEDMVVDGSKAVTNILNLHGMPAGAAFVVVEDNGGDDSDPEAVYTLAVTMKAEQDPQDMGARNDKPATATDCTGGCTKQGQIASKGDYDYYKVDISGSGSVSESNPAVIAISVDYGQNSKVEPQVALVYGDEKTPCTSDNCCRVLSGSCTNDIPGCARRTSACVQKDQLFCSDQSCKPSATCISEKACAGAVVCLPSGRCGGEQFARNDDNGEVNGAKVITAQPLLHPGPWYVRVGDLKNDEYDYGKSYTLNIQVRMDPDPGPLDSEYLPNQLSSQINTYILHKGYARTIPFGGSISGHISYQGDWDWYAFNQGADKEYTFSVSFSTSGDCTGVQPVYTLHKSGGDPWFSFPKDGQPLSGNPGCVYVNSSGGKYYWSVSDFNHDGWNWNCQYTLTFSPATGCLSPCVTHPVSGNCDSP